MSDEVYPNHHIPPEPLYKMYIPNIRLQELAVCMGCFDNDQVCCLVWKRHLELPCKLCTTGLYGNQTYLKHARPELPVGGVTELGRLVLGDLLYNNSKSCRPNVCSFLLYVHMLVGVQWNAHHCCDSLLVRHQVSPPKAATTGVLPSRAAETGVLPSRAATSPVLCYQIVSVTGSKYILVNMATFTPSSLIYNPPFFWISLFRPCDDI